MSGAVIAEFANRAARLAKRKGSQPWVCPADWDKYGFGDRQGICRVPNFGTYRPKGWTMRSDTLFVDKSGWGDSSEPALTIRAFFEQMETGVGYAMIEEGEFQCVVGVFDRK